MDNTLEGAAYGASSTYYFPFLGTRVRGARAKLLSCLVELSFIAGRAGDDLDEWEFDMDSAVEEAFGKLRPERRSKVADFLHDAFQAGRVNGELDRTEVPTEAMELARAYALIHEADIQFECERLPISNHWKASYIAHKVACRRAVTPHQAVKAAVAALEERGFRCLPARVAEVVGRAVDGEREREARNAILDDEAKASTALLDQIFDEEAGQ